MQWPWVLAVVVWCAGVAGAAGADVVVADEGDTLRMGNGEMEIVVSKATVQASSIRVKGAGGGMVEVGTDIGRAIYLDINTQRYGAAGGAGPASRPAAGYVHPMSMLRSVRVEQAGPGAGEIVAAAGPSATCPLAVEVHYRMARDVRGVYLYAVFRHGAGMAACDLIQTRFVARGRPGGSLFTHHLVDDARKGPYPTARAVETLQDATERLADGSVYTKYDLSQYTKDFLAQGMAGVGREGGLGLWFVWPSTEFCNGGPLRQDLTVHTDNIMQTMFQSEHFGAAPLVLKDGEAWEKTYGPVLLYANGGPTVEAMWADARARATAERAAWPYAWVKDDGMAARGRVRLADGAAPVGAWVVLSPDGEGVDDWAMSSKGYQFWTKVGGDGTFSIDKVRAGAYTLWVSGGDHFESFRRAGVTVRAGADTALGVLDRAPAAHGRRVWQVGVADRSVAEFRDGAEPDYRNYDTYKKYFRAFPEDVTFRVGESREAVDWNYAQWSWFNRKPVWTISFPMEAGGAAGKRATLTLGICSASLAGELEVKVNGARVARLAVARTGTASYRSRGQDSPYVVKVVTFDAGMLKAGANEITLGHTGAMPVPADADKAHLRLRAVMYDAVRLEIE